MRAVPLTSTLFSVSSQRADTVTSLQCVSKNNEAESSTLSTPGIIGLDGLDLSVVCEELRAELWSFYLVTQTLAVR